MLHGLNRDVNLLSSESRFQRKATLEKLIKRLEEVDETASAEDKQYFCKEILRPGLRALSDDSESCRGLGAKLVALMLPYLPEAALDGILQVLVGRIGVDPVQESSEDIRLEVLKTTLRAIEEASKKITNLKGNYIDFLRSIVVTNLKDPFSDIKKLCCECILLITKTWPKQIQYIAPNIIAHVRPDMRHKHAAVRKEMVKVYVELVLNGAHGVLKDEKKNDESMSTIHFLGMVIHDQSAHVRMEMLEGLGRWLMADVGGRVESHGKLLPMVLMALTDAHEKIRARASAIVTELGVHNMTNQHDSVKGQDAKKGGRDLTTNGDGKQAVPMDEDGKPSQDEPDLPTDKRGPYPDMSKFSTTTTIPQGVPLETQTPFPTHMMVVQYCLIWIPNILKQVADIDWAIPLSKVSRRQAALRCLQQTLRFVEAEVRRLFLPLLLDTFYRAIKDEDKIVSSEVGFLSELVGKFILPREFVFVMFSESDKWAIPKSEVPSKLRAVMGPRPILTWHTAPCADARISMVLVLGHLIKGTSGPFSQDCIKKILNALTDEVAAELDEPRLATAVLSVLRDLLGICQSLGLLQGQEHAFDYDIFHLCLILSSAKNDTIQQEIQQLIITLSQSVTGSPTGIYDRHFEATLDTLTATSNGSEAKYQILANLLTHSGAIQAKYTDRIIELFCQRLQHEQTPTGPLEPPGSYSLMCVLRAYLAAADGHGVVLTSDMLQSLIRSVILPRGHTTQKKHGPKWREPEPFAKAPHMWKYRRASIACLAEFIQKLPKGLDIEFDTNYKANQCMLACCNPDAEENPEVPIYPTLTEVIISTFDAEDSDLRDIAIQLAPHAIFLPMNEEHYRGVIWEVIRRFDDHRDSIRLKTAKALETIYEFILTNTIIDERCRNLLSDGPYLAEWVRNALVHMDDEDPIIQEAVCTTLQMIGRVNPVVVKAEVEKVRARHHSFHFCDKLLNELG